MRRVKLETSINKIQQVFEKYLKVFGIIGTIAVSSNAFALDGFECKRELPIFEEPGVHKESVGISNGIFEWSSNRRSQGLASLSYIAKNDAVLQMKFPVTEVPCAQHELQIFCEGYPSDSFVLFQLASGMQIKAKLIHLTVRTEFVDTMGVNLNGSTWQYKFLRPRISLEIELDGEKSFPSLEDDGFFNCLRL